MFYHIIKFLHLTFVFAGAAAIGLVTFLSFARLIDATPKSKEQLLSWAQRLFFVSIVGTALTAIYMTQSTGILSSPDDRWIWYQMPLFGVWCLSFWMQCHFLKKNNAASKKNGVMVVLVFIALIYLPVVRPYILNRLHLAESEMVPEVTEAMSDDVIEEIIE